MRSRPTIAIITDFGNEDAYVGVMEAVARAIVPTVSFIRLTQNILPQNVLSGAYVALSAWPWLPEGTVLLGVVDPGVGSTRRELIVSQGRRWMVCPDNGFASLILAHHQDARCYRAANRLLDELSRARPTLSRTFDGRDLFAPLAAKLASTRHRPARLLGESVAPVLIAGLEPERFDRGSLAAVILHVDRFGSCILSVHHDRHAALLSDCGWLAEGSVLEVQTDGGSITAPVAGTFSQVKEKMPLVYWGSSGFLELGVRNGNAAELFGLSNRSRVVLTTKVRRG